MQLCFKQITFFEFYFNDKTNKLVCYLQQNCDICGALMCENV